MQDYVLRVPVVCPQCSNESLVELQAQMIREALTRGDPIRLSASCHGQTWNANEVEREQLEEYLAVRFLAEAHSFKSPAPPASDPCPRAAR
jgi:hypothetical protein